MSRSSEAAPTQRQLHYLRSLATKTGTTFSYPATRTQASRQIDRLRKRGDAPREMRTGTDDDSVEQFVYSTAVHPDEVSGFGASATWRTSSPRSNLLGQPRESRREEKQLARYALSSGARVLYGRQVNGLMTVIDRPASATGRSYLVERESEFDDLGALEALLTDYVSRARELDEIPMASGAVRQLLAVGADA
jgi:hypothetical protein